jgi:hypothetical protein
MGIGACAPPNPSGACKADDAVNANGSIDRLALGPIGLWRQVASMPASHQCTLEDEYAGHED